MWQDSCFRILRTWKFQSTHPAWDVTLSSVGCVACRSISIHTSRMGCDHHHRPGHHVHRNFNPHIPHGMWPVDFLKLALNNLFQSTHPAWDVTGRFMGSHGCSDYFNPHIPHGMWPTISANLSAASWISIHTSRMGCDTPWEIVCRRFRYFNPHIPHGMWLFDHDRTIVNGGISIHTSRMGCDLHHYTV